MATPRKLGGSDWRGAIIESKQQVALLRDDLQDLAVANRDNNEVLVFLHTMSDRLDVLQSTLTELHEIGIEAKYTRKANNDDK